jgi:hypothetical protein
MVEYTGVVSKRGGIQQKQYGIKFFMELTDRSGRQLVNDDNIPVKFMVEVNGENDPRNTVGVGDVVRVTCRRDSEGWCSVTSKQEFGILEQGVRRPQIDITGIVSGRGRLRMYSGIPKFFIVVKTPDEKELKLMVAVSNIDQDERGYYSDDPVYNISIGDMIRVSCRDADAAESGWCHVRGSDIQVIRACSEEEKERAHDEWIEKKRRERDEAKSAVTTERKAGQDKIAAWFKRYVGDIGLDPSGYSITLAMAVLYDLARTGSMAYGVGGEKEIIHGTWQKPTGLRASSLYNKPESHRNAAMNVVLNAGWAAPIFKNHVEYFQITDNGRAAIGAYENWMEAQSEE